MLPSAKDQGHKETSSKGKQNPSAAELAEEDRLFEVRFKNGQIVERRVAQAPWRWKVPLVDVFDTMDAAHFKLLALFGSAEASDAIALTALVLKHREHLDLIGPEEEPEE